VSGEHACYLTKTGHPLKFRLLSIHFAPEKRLKLVGR
jgi:hypothetical protein